MSAKLPLYDDAGINLADPHDTRGHKTRYITVLHVEALRRLLAPVAGDAMDVGCGYGRMSRELAQLGYRRVIGVDPSSRLVAVAKEQYPELDFLAGALPNLPVSDASFHTLFLLNVLRSLHLTGVLEVARGAAKPLAAGGRLVVLDNVRVRHPDYIPEKNIVSLFESTGLRLVSRTVIRGARWPWTYLIQFGLIPRRWYLLIARFELIWMRLYPGRPRLQYHNVVWVFQKP